MKKMLIAVTAACYVSLGYAPILLARAEAPQSGPVSDVIAKVGDQTITFNEINVALNSSAIVGVSVPALGTPERDTVRVTLLDRFVSANLLYLDARKQGLDKDPVYQREVSHFDEAILADLYRQHLLMGDIAVSEEEIQSYYQKNVVTGTEFTPELHTAIESKLHREKLKQKLADARAHVRDGIKVTVHEDNLDIAGDTDRADSVVLAEIDGETITWGTVKDRIIAAGKGAVTADPLANEDDARRRALENEIDLHIMAGKGRAAGLDQDPVYKARTGEFHKTRLINTHRDRLVKQMTPTDEQLKAFYEANKASIVVPEVRKVQMVVLKSREEADQIKAKIADGEMTMYQAALEHSIAAKAKDDLGEVGWVYQGDTVPALDAAIFALGPGEISDPVETPAGWHLVSVQDVQPEKFSDFNDTATRQLTKRRFLDQKLDEYVVNLRLNEFPVEVYQEVMVRLEQQEADMVKQLAEQGEQPASITKQRLKELGESMHPGGE